MTKAVEKILAEVESLNEDERDELIEALLVGQEPSSDPEYVAAWEEEIRRRIDDMESGKVEGIPFEKALEMIKRGKIDG